MPADFPADIPVLESPTFDGWFNRLRSRVDFDTPRGPTPGRIDTDGYDPGFSVARFSGIIRNSGPQAALATSRRSLQ